MKLGIYEENKIYNEDSYLAIKKIPDKVIDLIIIDPPYLIDKHGSGGAFGSDMQKYHNEVRTMSEGIKINVLEEMVRVMKKVNIYIWCNKNQIYEYLKFFKEKKCNFDLITWHKSNPIPTCNNKYLSDTEYVCFFREKGVKVSGEFQTKRKFYVTPLNTKDKNKYKHPTIKPEEIIKNFIINSSEENDLVADFFLGSGTVCLASKKLNRKYIGFEIEPTYFLIAKKRIEEYTKEEKEYEIKEIFEDKIGT
ncbi:MAG: site-specific DNA-methyltransferase [Fusobacteriaceae bacterium]|nr:site-specific DNA-methyltransferase [Fusobacteriaceae bacterium]